MILAISPYFNRYKFILFENPLYLDLFLISLNLYHTSVPTFLLGIGYEMGIYSIPIPKYSIFFGILGMGIGHIPISYPIPNKKVGMDV